MSTVESTGTEALVERFGLKAIVESCLVLEEGVAGIKDIDLGMMAGAGIVPGPFARADEQGLDEVLAALERAQSEWGEQFTPPLILRRLVAQGRLGKKSGQGFFPYPQPDETYSQRETVLLERRGDIAIAWLNRPPANAISPQLVEDMAAIWSDVEGEARVLVITSSTPFTFSAGADIKEFTKMDPTDGAKLLDSAHALMRGMETSSTFTVAGVNSVAFGGGCELAMACDFRIAAQGASFGQPEINLGIIPGFGGTQRLPRLVGEGKAREMNLVGEPISAQEAERFGLANRVVPDHELFDTTMSWALKLRDKAPLAAGAIKTASAQGDLDAGLAAEKEGFARAFSSEDAKEGIAAFVGKRQARFQGK